MMRFLSINDYKHILAKFKKVDAAPVGLIGTSNHFEVAFATAAMLFGLGSGAALAAVVGVLIEVPLMLLLVEICKRTKHMFPAKEDEIAIRAQPASARPHS